MVGTNGGAAKCDQEKYDGKTGRCYEAGHKIRHDGADFWSKQSCSKGALNTGGWLSISHASQVRVCTPKKEATELQFLFVFDDTNVIVEIKERRNGGELADLIK